MIVGESEEWNNFVKRCSKSWAHFFKGWVVNAQQLTHVVRYDKHILMAIMTGCIALGVCFNVVTLWQYQRFYNNSLRVYVAVSTCTYFIH